jgi:hypothetical protein
MLRNMKTRGFISLCMDMPQEGKGNKAVCLSEKKEVATATCMTRNKEAEDSNAMVNGSRVAVVCNFSYITM